MIGVILGFDYPKTCSGCKLFIDGIVGHTPFCSAGGKYSDREIKKEKDGSLCMYYHGCLSHRPENCPLRDVFLEEGEAE